MDRNLESNCLFSISIKMQLYVKHALSSNLIDLIIALTQKHLVSNSDVAIKTQFYVKHALNSNLIDLIIVQTQKQSASKSDVQSRITYFQKKKVNHWILLYGCSFML